MGIKLREGEIDELTDVMEGYDCCQLCYGIESLGSQVEVYEGHGETICNECLEDLPHFVDWVQDGNVIWIDGVFRTQDAFYMNRLNGVRELVEYAKKQFWD